jgi:hypothetical protein
MPNPTIEHELTEFSPDLAVATATRPYRFVLARPVEKAPGTAWKTQSSDPARRHVGRAALDETTCWPGSAGRGMHDRAIRLAREGGNGNAEREADHLVDDLLEDGDEAAISHSVNEMHHQ